MSKIKVARKVEFLLTLKTEEKDNIIYQTYEFWTNNKKYLKYAYDKRYCLRSKLEKIYESHLLNNFISREEYESKIIFKYEKDGDFTPQPSKIINCEFYLPPFNGCKYCRKCRDEGNFLYCEEKKKHYDSTGIKNCQVFQSVDEIIT